MKKIIVSNQILYKLFGFKESPLDFMEFLGKRKLR